MEDKKYALIKNGIVENVIIGSFEIEGYETVLISEYRGIHINCKYDANTQIFTNENDEVFAKMDALKEPVVENAEVALLGQLMTDLELRIIELEMGVSTGV